TAMTGLAPTFRAAAIADRPTPPAPQTATLCPGPTSAEWSTAPAPVITAQPITAPVSRGVPAGARTTYRSSATVCVAQVNTLPLAALVPSAKARRGPSGLRNTACGERGTHVTKTVSPGATCSTAEPAASTTPVDS